MRQIDNLFIIYLSLKRNFILNVITGEHLTFLAACHQPRFKGYTDSENVSLIRLSVSDDPKTQLKGGIIDRYIVNLSSCLYL